MFRRKPANLSELQSNPHFPFYVGRLVGAAEVTSHWLSLQQGSEYQEMGRRLGTVVGWFLPEQGHMGTSEYSTAVLPPPTKPKP
jgi:hypothetical protein